MGKIIDLNPPPMRESAATPRRRLPDGAGPRSPRVQLRMPLASLAETEQHLDTLTHAVLRAQRHLNRAKRTGGQVDALDALELVRKAMERANKGSGEQRNVKPI